MHYSLLNGWNSSNFDKKFGHGTNRIFFPRLLPLFRKKIRPHIYRLKVYCLFECYLIEQYKISYGLRRKEILAQINLLMHENVNSLCREYCLVCLISIFIVHIVCMILFQIDFMIHRNLYTCDTRLWIWMISNRRLFNAYLIMYIFRRCHLIFYF